MAMDYSQRKQYVLQMCEMLRIHAAGYFKNKEVSITVSGQQRNPLCCWNCAGLALCSHRRSQMGISSRVSFLPHSLLSLLKHRTVSVQDLRGSAGDAAEELGTAWNWGSVKIAQAHSFLKQPQQQWENSVTCCCLCHSCKLLSVPYKKPSLSRWAQKCMKASLGAPTELVVFFVKSCHKVGLLSGRMQPQDGKSITLGCVQRLRPFSLTLSTTEMGLLGITSTLVALWS